MTEKIIRLISEIIGENTVLRLKNHIGVSLLPDSASDAVSLLDGGKFCSVKIRARFKGENAAELFKLAEEAFAKVKNSPFYENISLEAETPPILESCGENGLYIVSCTFRADYIID